LEVEIWSDIACPWCYVGKRRFEAALAQFEHRDDVTITWRSFELDPEAPAERAGDRAEHLARKYGMSLEQAQQAEAQMTQTAAGEGLDFRFDIARAGNTFDGHRLVHLAKAHGLQDAMKERLLRAYFSDGELISDHEALARVARDVGLPEVEVRETLASDRYAAEVREDERTAHSFAIGAVPTFVVDRQLGASGAQPPEQLLSLLRQGWAQRKPPVGAIVGSDGEACGVDGC
jgi:predicted DsbA family dithiol-disulfide isomerase